MIHFRNFVKALLNFFKKEEEDALDLVSGDACILVHLGVHAFPAHSILRVFSPIRFVGTLFELVIPHSNCPVL